MTADQQHYQTDPDYRRALEEKRHRLPTDQRRSDQV